MKYTFTDINYYVIVSLLSQSITEIIINFLQTRPSYQHITIIISIYQHTTKEKFSQ